MVTCDVLIVGGGPAGSTCARMLCRAGFDVTVMDAALFPREKVCAGWITPQAVAALQLDVEQYRQNRIFQEIHGFRTGVIGGHEVLSTVYDHPVSYGIRRCEFDHYLLNRAGARLVLGAPVTTIRREGVGWVVNDRVRTPMLVGAGGHFCPVARLLNGSTASSIGAPLVVAQEAECALAASDARGLTIEPGVPELSFCRDLKGYGWCIRKENYLSIGLGRVDRQSLRSAVAEFLRTLVGRGTVPPSMAAHWRGHAYLLRDDRHRRVLDRGVLLLGDAAGLASPLSGEGIRPAIESGLLAASTIIDAGGRYTQDRLEPYAAHLFAAIGTSLPSKIWSRVGTSSVGTALGRLLLGTSPFVRQVVLDRWFLHAEEQPLSCGGSYGRHSAHPVPD